MVQLKLRFKEELRRRLEPEARKRDHSLNSEIIERLEASFQFAKWQEQHERWREERERWQEQRERMLLLVGMILERHPDTAAKKAMEELQDDADRAVGEDVMGGLTGKS